jgi:hypothetical protein
LTEMYKLARPLLRGVKCQIINSQVAGIKNRMVTDLLAGMPQFGGEIVVGNPVDPTCHERTEDFLNDERDMSLFVFWVYDMKTTENYSLQDRLKIAEPMIVGACPPYIQFVEHELISTAEGLAAYTKKVVGENFFPGIVLREPYGTFGTYDEEIPKESLTIQ